MAFDPVSQKLILFGGSTDPTLGTSASTETWSWDGHRWTQLHPDAHPPGAYGARLVTDPTSGHLMLLGGETAGGSKATDPGVWGWDGTNWSRLVSPPFSGFRSMAAADPASGQVIVISPASAAVPGGAASWNGSAWTVTPDANIANQVIASGPGLAFDPVSKRLIEFGGVGQTGAFGGTSAWDGVRWTTLTPGGQTPREGQGSAVTDEGRGEIVMVARPLASDPSTPTTWTWDGSSWHRASGAPPPDISVYSLAYDPVVDGVVFFGGNTFGRPPSLSASMYVWRGNGWEMVPAG